MAAFPSFAFSSSRMLPCSLGRASMIPVLPPPSTLCPPSRPLHTMRTTFFIPAGYLRSDSSTRKSICSDTRRTRSFPRMMTQVNNDYPTNMPTISPDEHTTTNTTTNTPSSSAYYRGEILCNRALNMAKIKAVGFDMDYTLAMYHSERFESLAATNALYKLVHHLDYPDELLALKYDHSKFIRGLVVDKYHGNILKLDRHKYVKRAMHGHMSLSKEARAKLYDHITHSGGGFGEPRFAVLDAMFALPDAFLFSSVVAYKDKHPEKIKHSYERIYNDVRRSVDMCHRDGSIKDRVAQSPQHFIQRDVNLIATLRKLRRSGRKVFLLTNSLWNYTDVVMKYLYGDEEKEKGHWIDLFDVIITASAKPAFMLNTRLPIYRCDPETGVLRNTEGVYNETAEMYLARGKCFQGGNFTHLHDLLGVENGTQILYVGDHIFSDVLRSKRTLGWRTMLVVPELEQEVNTLYHPDTVTLADEIALLHDTRDELDEWVDRLEGILVADNDDDNNNKHRHKDKDKDSVEARSSASTFEPHADADTDTDCSGNHDASAASGDSSLSGSSGSSGTRRTSPPRLCEVREELEAARCALLDVHAKIGSKVEAYHCRFHPIWGQLFKTGLQNSRFAEQVESYACLYTSCVSNIGLISPEVYWRAMNDLMPHDRLTVAPMHRVLSRRASVLDDVDHDDDE